MASGESLRLRYIHPIKRVVTADWDRKDRDRTLAGKKRIRARRSK